LKFFLPELLTKYPPVPATLETALVTAGIGALVGWGTKVIIVHQLREFTTESHRWRMAVPRGICFAVFPERMRGQQSQWQPSSL
jgi:hypothetical protein